MPFCILKRCILMLCNSRNIDLRYKEGSSDTRKATEAAFLNYFDRLISCLLLAFGSTHRKARLLHQLRLAMYRCPSLLVVGRCLDR